MPHSCLTLCSPPAAYTCSPCLPHTQLPDAVYPVSVCSASPTPVERTLKRRLSAVLPIRNAPIRIRFEQVCSCERSNLIPKDPVIPNLILNLIPIPASMPLRRYCERLRWIAMDCEGL
jgi:hypothetical protein